MVRFGFVTWNTCFLKVLVANVSVKNKKMQILNLSNFEFYFALNFMFWLKVIKYVILHKGMKTKLLKVVVFVSFRHSELSIKLMHR